MQKIVKDFNENMPCHKKPMPASARLLDIQSELGELAKEYLKASKYGTLDFAVDEQFMLEYGDVLYSLLSLANEVGMDASDCLQAALNKYQKRIDEKKSMGSGK